MAGGLKYQSPTSLDQMRHLGDFVEWGWVEVKIDPDFVCVTKAGRQKQKKKKKGRREREKEKERKKTKEERKEGRKEGRKEHKERENKRKGAGMAGRFRRQERVYREREDVS